MWSSYPFELSVLAVVIALAVYFWILKKMGIFPFKTAAQTTDSLLLASRPTSRHSLIDTISPNVSQFHANSPSNSEVFEAEFEAENWDDIEFVEVEQVSFLMQEADYVVEQIQDVLAHIASNPPNPDEVASKVASIVQPYRIFFDTEYYDSINAYISLAVERDCGIKFPKAEIESLWLKASA